MIRQREDSSIRVKTRITYLKYVEPVFNGDEVAELHILIEQITRDSGGKLVILEHPIDRPEFGKTAVQLLDDKNSQMLALKSAQQKDRDFLQDHIDQLDAIVNPA